MQLTIGAQDTVTRTETATVETRRPWRTPAVITSEIEDTELNPGTNADGGAPPTNVS